SAGDRLPRWLPVGHDRHKSVVFGGLLPPPRSRLRALRLFRPRLIERRFRPRHDRPLARGCDRGHRFADRRTANPCWIEHGRLDHAACGVGTPERIMALVGIAASPDFTTELLPNRLSPEQRRELEQQGAVTLPSEYDPAG